MFVSVLLFILFFVPISALPFSLSSQSSDSAQVPQNLAPFSPNPPQVLQNLASSSSNPAQTSPTFPTWLAVERVPFSTDNVGGDAVLVRAEHCLRPCAEVLGSAGAVSIPRARCVCRCPSGEQLFVQTAEGTGKCAAKAPDCPGRTFRFDRSSENADPQMFAPVLSLPRQGEALSTELRIAWKESGVKVRPGHGPRCSIQSAFLLASQAIWRPLDGDLFRLGWMDGEGRVIWTGIEKDAEELAGGIVQLVLECAAGKSGNGSFCVAFRVEGQIESQFALRGEDSTAAGDVGVELDSGRRAEVVAIILLAILLFLSVCSSIFLWNVCWRMEKRKLIQSLQLQFLHYAKQEKDKTIAECQLRYQALVKAAAGVQHQQQQQHGSASPHIGIANGGFLNANGGGSTTDGEEYGLTSMDTPQQQRRKLYFSAEFFEPHLMSNPPPMAEQFLYDLRKMVAVARERIRTRRHIPRLHAIVESDDEGASNYSKQPNSWKDCDERKQQQQKPQRGEASPQQRTDDEPKKFEQYSDGKLQGKDGQKTKQYTGDEKARREAAAAATEKLESHSEDDQVGKGVNKGLKQLNDDKSVRHVIAKPISQTLNDLKQLQCEKQGKNLEKITEQFTEDGQVGMDVWKKIKQFTDHKQLVNGGKVENNVDKLKQYSDYKPAWRDIVGREVKQLRNDENKKKQLEEKAEEADDDCSNLMQFGDEKVGENVEKKKVSNNAKVREANSKRLTDEEEPTTGKDVWKRIQQFNELRPHTEEENIRKNAETGTNQLSKDAKVGSDLGKGVQQQPKSDERVGKNVQKERKQFTDSESVGVNVRKKVHQFTDAKPPTADDEKVGKSAEKKLNQQLNDEQIGKKLRQLGSKEQIGRELFQDEKKLNKPTNDGQLSEDLGNGLKQYLYCQLNGKERMKPFKDEAPIKEEDCWDNKFKQSTDKQQFGEDCEVSKIDETKSEFCTNEAFRGNGGIPQKIKACEAPLEQNGIESMALCSDIEAEKRSDSNGFNGHCPSSASEINNSLALCSPKPATILNNDGTDKKDAGRGQLPKALEPNKTEAEDCTPSSSLPPRNELTRNPSEVIVENLSDDDTSTTPSSTSEAEDEGEKEDELTSLRIKTAATEAVNRKFVALAPAATPSSSAKLEQPPQQQQNQSLGASRIPIGVASTSGSNGSKLPRASLLKFGTVQKQSPAAVAEHQPPPLPPNPPPAEEEPKPRMKKSLLQQPNGSNSLTLMKRRGSAGASTAALTVEKFATDVGPSGSKNHHRTLLNNYRSAIPTSIPCPTTYSLNSNPPSASFPPSSVSYAVSPPDNHIKKSLPRRKKLNGANGGAVPPFAANGNGMATNLKMPTVV